MSYNTILYEKADGVLTITLNRPDKLNAATDELLGELVDAFKQAGKDGEVRAVVLTGAGRGFCAGQDLDAVQSRYDNDEATIAFGDHLRHTWNKVVQQMHRLPKPIICAVNGVAAGAGMSLVLASDLRYASDRAVFVQAFVNIGLIPDSGSTWALQRLVGPTRATEMMITGRKVTAQEAEAWGMLNGVVAGDALIDEAHRVAAQLALMPTRAIGLIKRATDFAADSTLDEALEYEADLQDLAGRTHDHREGVTAFIEKRKAQFIGA